MDQEEINYTHCEPIFIHVQEIGNNQTNNSQFYIATASSKSQIHKQKEQKSSTDIKTSKIPIIFKNYLLIKYQNDQLLLNDDFNFQKIRESFFLQQELGSYCPAILPVYKIIDLKKDDSFEIATKFLKKGILSTYLPGFIMHPNQICTFEKLSSTKKTIIAYGIAQSMKYIHSKQIFFHNLTPDNIFLDDNYYPYLTDFYKCDEKANDIILQNDVFHYSIIYISLFGPIEIIQPNSSTNSDDFKQNSPIHILSSMKCGARPRLDDKLDMTENQKNLLKMMWDPNQIKLTFVDIIEHFENGDLIFTGTDMNFFNEYKKLFADPQSYFNKIIDESKEFCYLADIPFENDAE